LVRRVRVRRCQLVDARSFEILVRRILTNASSRRGGRSDLECWDLRVPALTEHPLAPTHEVASGLGEAAA
jgi:hypothetical protein